jgi:hypothetical protein
MMASREVKHAISIAGGAGTSPLWTPLSSVPITRIWCSFVRDHQTLGR